MSIRSLCATVVSLARPVRKAVTIVAASAVLAACNVALPGGGSGGDGVGGSGPTKVALLVPFGSAQSTDATLARSLENAARLAAADLGAGVVSLTVYPTQGTPGGAGAAASRAVSEGAQVILGPLYAENAAAAGVAASGSGVPVISFSNNTAIAGGNVWVIGNTFENTARRVLRYAAGQGRNRVLVTHSNDANGQIANAAVISAASGSGAQITGSVPYQFSQAGIAAAVPGIASQARSTNSNAVFLTGTGTGDLPVLAQLLSESGITGDAFRFLGLTRWDIPAETLQQPGLQGGYFALPDPAPLQQFRSRYSSAYGSQPHPVANLAYDGMAAIGAISRRGATVGRSSLTSNAGFVGTGGVFRLRSDGTVDRALAVAQIVNRQIQVVSPAPKSFGGAGS